MEESSDDLVIAQEDGRLWCKLCKCLVPGNQPKNIKQHTKSITHKKMLKSGNATETKKSRQESIQEGFQVITVYSFFFLTSFEV